MELTSAEVESQILQSQSRTSEHTHNTTKMRGRGGRVQLQSRDRDGSLPQHDAPATTKIFNCIVDDISLVQGAKKSTRDGIRKWVSSGHLRLFVPLYSVYTLLNVVIEDMQSRAAEADVGLALSQTSRMKSANNRLATGAGEALLWLDDATSTNPHLVKLQEPYEQFKSWSEVEAFALPETLFSESDGAHHSDEMGSSNLADEVEANLVVTQREKQDWPSFSSVDSRSRPSTPATAPTNRSGSPLSPPTSPLKANVGSVPSSDDGKSRTRPMSTQTAPATSNGEEGTGLPEVLRPLYNYILWRVHQETDPRAALETFIFLTDDPFKRKCAQRFGIRVKSLEEIRYAVARETREARNKKIVQQKEEVAKTAQKVNSRPISAKTSPIPPAPAQPILPAGSVVSVPGDEGAEGDEDEDEVVFKRVPKVPAAMRAPESKTPPSPAKVIDPDQFSRNMGPSNRGGMIGRARGGLVVGRGARPRGGSINGGRGGSKIQASSIVPNEVTSEGPIDPNSFARPRPTSASRGRGGRGLWMPT